MGRFDMAKRFRSLLLLFTPLAIAAFIIFDPRFTLLLLLLYVPLSPSLVCKKCSKLYLEKPFHFLLTGQGSGVCIHCGHEN